MARWWIDPQTWLGMARRVGVHRRAEFDMKKGTLRLIFQKDASDDTSACRDVRQLSGGEKSYTNLAMLLALGKCHECPFR